MGKKLSELPSLNYNQYATDDLMSIHDTSENKSCSTTIKDIVEYTSNLNNGGFKGVAKNSNINSLDDFTWKDAGVWRFDGVCEEINLVYNTGAIVEIICYTRQDNATQEEPDCLFQRVTYGINVYQRFKIHDQWLNWNCLSNRNNNLIDYGSMEVSATDQPISDRISFTENQFAGYTEDGRYPTVVCSVIAPSGSTSVYAVNVNAVDFEGFSFTLFSSDRQASFDTEEVHATSTGDEESTSETTKTTVIKNVYGPWNGPKETVTINYIATLSLNADNAGYPIGDNIKY